TALSRRRAAGCYAVVREARMNDAVDRAVVQADANLKVARGTLRGDTASMTRPLDRLATRAGVQTRARGGGPRRARGGARFRARPRAGGPPAGRHAAGAGRPSRPGRRGKPGLPVDD